ncbi:MAG: hypothetical protein A3G34_15135 [Candidatus Lindowbacteria bacterium RIFCSPLOWO2_12_FULL_62_27]|nr:MAG: hypothetical protein A3G34_15135 [Candidatus Lindowbacteria bacterium RIFCSPLOWO2_12_FULL_62_27]OGH63859.1 MAG: hypothetical protein A3I06_06115 [Candidatus Lindowbacteria bacterium RIFCSPLOWO2_02_FULL_62_12]
MDRPPIRDGGVIWRGGRIVRVGRRADILSRPVRIAADAPDAILMPGLINAHAHLELSRLAGKIPRLPFTDWLARIAAARRTLTGADIRRGIREGEQRLLALGVTSVVDIASFQAARETPRTLRTRVLHEIVGLRNPVRIPRKTAVSPHAPYSLSDSNLDRVARWWDRRPYAFVSMHIAESNAENCFFKSGTGPFKSFYARMGLSPRPSPGRRVVAHLDGRRLLRRGLLAVHVNDIRPAEARLLTARGVAVAVCPGSLAFFGFPRSGVRRLIEAGAAILFGTDSLASNGDLNLFAELRRARAYWRLPPERIIRSATQAPGRWIWDGRAGRIAAGAYADFILVGARTRMADPFSDLLSGHAERRIRLRVVGGKIFGLTRFCP